MARCGDGIRRQDLAEGEAGFEQCDDGNSADTDTCLTSCLSARCGDGFVQAGVEACDDGNEVETDACRNSCCAAAPACCKKRRDLRRRQRRRHRRLPDQLRATRCQRRRRPARVEACDDGNRVETDACRNACVVARCGDGVVQAGVEACDDANDNDQGRVPNQLRLSRLR